MALDAAAVALEEAPEADDAAAVALDAAAVTLEEAAEADEAAAVADAAPFAA